MKGAIKLILLLISVLVAFPTGGILANRLPLFDPPGFPFRVKTYLTGNDIILESSSIFPELRPKEYNIDAQGLFVISLEASKDLGWEIKESDPLKGTIKTVITTKLFHFKDDLFIKVVVIDDDHSTLSVQSKSRVGRGDLGANTRHIIDLVSKIEKSLARS